MELVPFWNVEAALLPHCFIEMRCQRGILFWFAFSLIIHVWYMWIYLHLCRTILWCGMPREFGSMKFDKGFQTDVFTVDVCDCEKRKKTFQTLYDNKYHTQLFIQIYIHQPMRWIDKGIVCLCVSFESIYVFQKLCLYWLVTCFY